MLFFYLKKLIYTISTLKKSESEHFTLSYTSNFILLQRDLEVTVQLEKKKIIRLMRYYWTLVLYWQQFLLAQIPVESTCQRRRLCRVGDQQSFGLGQVILLNVHLYTVSSVLPNSHCVYFPSFWNAQLEQTSSATSKILHLVLYVMK